MLQYLCLSTTLTSKSQSEVRGVRSITFCSAHLVTSARSTIMILENLSLFMGTRRNRCYTRVGALAWRASCCFTPPPARALLLNRLAFELQEMDALRQKVSVWFGDETASGLATAPQLRARLKRLAPEEVPFLQVRRRLHELLSCCRQRHMFLAFGTLSIHGARLDNMVVSHFCRRAVHCCFIFSRKTVSNV